MNDRELLKLAAKAAGIERRNAIGFYIIEEEDDNRYWNPLTDDGDALRLAVKLRLRLQFVEWSDGETLFVHKDMVIEAEDIVDADPYAATRRAIVSAAAKIGKEMK